MSVPRVWRLQVHNYRLEGGICSRCGAKAISRRRVCSACEEPPYLPPGIPVEILISVPCLEHRELAPVPVELRPPGKR